MTPHPLHHRPALCGVFVRLQVTEEQSYALLEYVIHLIAKDYPATLEDLIVLGFISPEVGDDPEKVALVVPLLAKVCALFYFCCVMQGAECVTLAQFKNSRGL